MRFLIDGVPEVLKLATSNEYKMIFNQTQRLYLLGSLECICNIATQMNYPSFLDNGFCIFQTLSYVKVIIDDKCEDLPICADIRFFRRPQDTMIVAVSTCTSKLYHADVYEEKLLNQFPQVLTNRRENLFYGSNVESSFSHWCQEKITSRKPFINEILKAIG